MKAAYRIGAAFALVAMLGQPIAAHKPARHSAPATDDKPYYPPEPPPLPAWLAPAQYLYGSGEAAALSRMTWAALVDYTTRALSYGVRQSVVLAPEATLASLRFADCDAKPPAAVFDIDETVLLNLGWAAADAVAGGRAYDDERWQRWEKTGAGKAVATPGAIEGVARLRALGVTVVFNSNRDAAQAAETIAALADAGLGQAVRGETLFLKGDEGDPTTGAKDARRQRIAGLYCVIAMAGDQLGDFTDLFAEVRSVPERRAVASLPGIADMWGEGWFVFPNPTYGSALQGNIDEIFPADKRWTDPGAGLKAQPQTKEDHP